MNASLFAALAEAGARRGSARTVYCPETTLSRTGLASRVNRRARELEGLGIGPADVVVLSLGNVAEFAVLLLAINRIGAVIRLVDPSDADRGLFAATQRMRTRAVIRRPRGVDQGPIDYASGHVIEARRKLSGSLLTVDMLAAPDSLAPPCPGVELIVDAAGDDAIVREIQRDGASLLAIGRASAALLSLDGSTRILCSESLTVPAFFDPVILGWLVSDCALVMAEDPTLMEGLSLARGAERLVIVDSARQLFGFARAIRAGSGQVPLVPVVPQSTLPTRAAAVFEAAYGQPPRQLARVEELGLLGQRVLARDSSFEAAPGVTLTRGKAVGDGHEVLVTSDQLATAITPSPEVGAPGCEGQAGAIHSGFVGKFGRKGLIEITGRADGLVTIEGRRVSLRAMERAMLTHRRMQSAEALLEHDADGEPILRLRYRATGETPLEDLEEHAVGNLLPHQVPRTFERIS